jgi:hypothetical protein
VKNKKIVMHTDKPSKMTNTLILEPTEKGTLLTHEIEYKLPYSFLGKIIDKVSVSKDVKKELEQWLPNAKKALEEWSKRCPIVVMTIVLERKEERSQREVSHADPFLLSSPTKGKIAR